ncbi:hypothetical protein DKY63_21150 [Pseudomonas putida]|uniref:Uncharacterized protein n=1 Tax=Pseudomonas putida TaxID=303 RepID=A0A2Z4RMC5_PSEPU|nr:hypothetical protein [Pseudomonas putida]AWY42273.1 hypothetical protein DKY63_21150 [Pseudomonas putida]
MFIALVQRQRKLLALISGVLFSVVMLLLYIFITWPTCAQRALSIDTIRDHLEVYAVIGFGEVPKCPLPWRDATLALKLSEKTSFWVRTVHMDSIMTPEPNQQIEYLLATESGEIVVGAQSYTGKVQTDVDGFARLPFLTANTIGVYRVRLIYNDRSGKAISYSSPIIVH